MQPATTRQHPRYATLENVIWISLFIAILALMAFLILSALWQDIARFTSI